MERRDAPLSAVMGRAAPYVFRPLAWLLVVVLGLGGLVLGLAVWASSGGSLSPITIGYRLTFGFDLWIVQSTFGLLLVAASAYLVGAGLRVLWRRPGRSRRAAGVARFFILVTLVFTAMEWASFVGGSPWQQPLSSGRWLLGLGLLGLLVAVPGVLVAAAVAGWGGAFRSPSADVERLFAQMASMSTPGLGGGAGRWVYPVIGALAIAVLALVIALLAVQPRQAAPMPIPAGRAPAATEGAHAPAPVDTSDCQESADGYLVCPGTSPAPSPAATPAPTPQPDLCGAPSNRWDYNFCGGTPLTEPPVSFCDSDSGFTCIPSFWHAPDGYVVECADGEYSHSGGVSGACSDHGGESQPLDVPAQ